jgi:hypothetical protein
MPTESKLEKTDTEVSGQMQQGVMREISCDEVAWLLNIFDRYLPKDNHPRVSREREMKKYGMLYEVMENARLSFADDSARWNGTPNDARNYGDEDASA